MSRPEPSIEQIKLAHAQRHMALMHQFFLEHGLREKKKLRGNDWERLQRIRESTGYADAFAGQPLISVIVPTYNRAQVIVERTLPSVQQQSYANWELLIVGDRMEESQAALLRAAAAGDSRVRFHNLKFRGNYPSTKGPMWYVAGTKPVNFGLRCARGAWIAHLDDDDEFLPEHLSTLLQTAQAERSEWAHSLVKYIDDQGREQGTVGSTTPSHGCISRIGSLYHAGLKTFRYNPGCWKYFYPGDWDLWERLLDMGVRNIHAPRITAIHHGDYFRDGVLNADNAPATGFAPGIPNPADTYRDWLKPQELAPSQLAAQQAREDLCEIHAVVIDTSGDTQALQRTLASLDAQQHRRIHISVLSPNTTTPETAWIDQFHALAKQTPAEWLLPLHAGDELAKHALLVLAERAAAQPAWVCCYVDEDAREKDGYGQPLLKPDLNLDMLRSYPYIGRTLAIKREALLAGDGLDARHGALAHYDFAFCAIEQHGLAAVGHIDEVLYHAGKPYTEWLVSEEVASQSAGVVDAHLQRLGIPHEMLPGPVSGMNRVRYVHTRQPPVSIIIPTRDQLPLLNGLIDSLLAKTTYTNFELLIVDNNSEEPAACAYLDGIEKLNSSQLRVLRYPHPFNYSAINNFAAAQARGEYLILLNNDTAVLQDDWIESLLNHAQRPEVGIVGAKLYFPDGRVQHGGVVLGLRGPADHPFIGMPMDATGYMHRLQVDQNYTAVTAACLMIRKSIYDSVGGLDEQDFKVSYNDVDLCLKVHQAGYLTVWTPYARLMHVGSVSQNNVDKTAQEAKHKRFQNEQNAMYRKWLPLLARDPAYNRNLNLDGPGFELDPRRNLGWQPLAKPMKPRLYCVPADATGCGNYRVMQPFVSMYLAGMVDGTVADTHLTPIHMERFAPDSIILQRQLSDDQLTIMRNYKDFIRAFKVYELDDYLPQIPIKSAFHKVMPKDVLKVLRKAVALTDRFVVSTEPLAEQFAGLHSDIRVVRNRLPVHWWDKVSSERRKGRKPRVGWGGGASHRGDLELITDVVRDLANEVEWVFFGMCPDKLRPYVHEFHEGVPITEYPRKLASLNLDLALAPLEENLFNECKSNLRLLEYGACGYPVICSDIVCYRDDLPVTRVKNRYKDWISAIRMHLDDLDATARMGDALRDAVRKDWMLTEDKLVEWRSAWLPN
ncbi:glycosyltransferase [Dyella psychrodurans]|uniref:Glycosyltransferase n=1 Tax=Dyella psychrodurans TaxID=1927960 RepID=A0A370X0J1_9GAMM|nr:glycosyltransferase [Dyella psychrodurans]RDS81862.1 glycosyltransferase [Dyella psychrodurans]